MSVAAVVVAAGQGSRFGGPKQFAILGEESVAARSVRLARSVAELVILVAPLHYDGDGEGADLVVTGGATRADSVRAGLAHCADAEVVVVHDAARPLASIELFRSVVACVRAGADAAVPGLALSDTLKRVRDDHGEWVVDATIEREGLVVVQTPQAFRRDVLERAHADSAQASDDAGLVELIGARVVVVDGESTNVKLTHPEDLAVLERSVS